MKKENKAWIIALILIFVIAGCKAKTDTTPRPPQELNDFDKQVQAIKEQATTITQNPAIQLFKNATSSASQTVFVPVPQSTTNTVSASYKAPCDLENYRVLNTYCSAKNFFHNQGTLISWYLSYPKLFFMFLLLLLIIVIWMLWKNKN